MNKIVFISGATSGIGKATAGLLGEKGFRLILTGRREQRLEEIRSELTGKTEVLTLCMDVRNKEEVFRKIKTLPVTWKNIDILINNAGNAHGLDLIHEGDTDDWDAMMDINVKGLLYVSRAIIPGMVERKYGHIINMGSIAGKEVYPKGNVYCGSKFAVDAISDGMRLDLLPFGIKVSQVNPGLVETEFSKVRFKGDEERAAGVYKGLDPLTPMDIAEVIHFILTRPFHVNLSDLIVLPAQQAGASMVFRKE